MLRRPKGKPAGPKGAMVPKHQIKDAARLAGVSESVLRVWEHRYGYPKPTRSTAGGYRLYTDFEVETIARIARLVALGTPVSALIFDGEVRFPTETVTPVRPASFNFDSVPQPTTDAGQALRRDLEAAIRRGDIGAVERCAAQVITIHPRDRENAVTAVLRLAAKEGFQCSATKN